MHQHTHTHSQTPAHPHSPPAWAPRAQTFAPSATVLQPGISAVLCVHQMRLDIYTRRGRRLRRSRRPHVPDTVRKRDYKPVVVPERVPVITFIVHTRHTHTRADRNAKDPSELPTHIHAGTYGHTRTRVRTYDAQYFSSVDTLSAFVCQRELCDGLSALADAVYN